MKKAVVPRNIDFKPTKQYAKIFEKEGSNSSVFIKFPELNRCPACGKQKFLDQKVCGGCIIKKH